MSIYDICNAIEKAIAVVRKPLVQIPTVLAVCGAVNKPSLSPMLIAVSIIARRPEAGAYCGPAPDGSQNVDEAMEVIRIEEICKAIKNDLSIQGGIPPGGIHLTGTAMTNAGPAAVEVVNDGYVKVWGGAL